MLFADTESMTIQIISLLVTVINTAIAAWVTVQNARLKAAQDKQTVKLDVAAVKREEAAATVERVEAKMDRVPV